MRPTSKKLSKKEFICHVEDHMGLFDIEAAKKSLKEERTLDLDRERKFTAIDNG